MTKHTHSIIRASLGAKVGVFQWVKYYIVSGYKLLFEKHFGALSSLLVRRDKKS